MGRTKVRKTSFSNCPKITTTLSSNMNVKLGTHNARMDTEQSSGSSLRLNGYVGNHTSNTTVWSLPVRISNLRPEHHPPDPNPLRSHMRYFGQQVFQSDVACGSSSSSKRTLNGTKYKYTFDVLNDIRQHMYFAPQRNERTRSYGERVPEKRAESDRSHHTFANLLRYYGYHNNWLMFKFGHTYQKESMYRRKNELWTQQVRGEPDVARRSLGPEHAQGHAALPQLHPIRPEHTEQKNICGPPKNNGNLQDYGKSSCPTSDNNTPNGSLESEGTSTSTESRASSSDQCPDTTPLETTTTVPSDVQTTVEDPLSKSIWHMFLANKQSESTFARKMRLWETLYHHFQRMASWLPKYELYLMGSTISGFGTDTSDMDMCIVDIDGPRYCDARTEALNNLLRVKSFIETMSTSSCFERLLLIRAKVPILRFRHVKENIDIDLSINNRVGIRNTHLLHCYAQLDLRVRPLVMVIKLWAQHHNLNDPKNSTMSSYSLVLMVLNFLQCGVTPSVVPCLHSVYPEKFAQDDYNSNLLERIDPYRSDNKDTLGELLLKFFKYYAEFDYAIYAISVRTGTILPISECKWSGSENHRIRGYLFIEEPFNRTNTGKSVHKRFVFERIRGAFAASWKMLEEHDNLSILFREPLFTSSSIPTTTSYF
ncbi:poly(A) RNA polymerase GLD2-like [Anopheles stephensi]|uniref:poly(A) RNA polymerase GLD2-like n=1 Tax=Anopheles stephensi TaxID=30069 RepID=UPI0016589D68|nr:poly(A) RNA polymerase GLD2-like [Anopheles stephensi]XP_035900772.1 poly(A) RNA polymerase GLD2-like [Anopheles stephensi]